MASASLNVDDSNPYHLQNGDLPRSMLVSKVLTRDNYHSWCKSMEMTLKAKNKMEFINGAVVQPTDTDPLCAMWDPYNSMVLSNCTCGATCMFLEHQQHQNFIMFLIRLNEEFSHIGLILLMEPLPPITKIFCLVIQEDK
ncbi:hypothetical protein I3760_03G133200 [Carya illinoinensis]|nr:hypothetical protein I3760_03G133200 [Carya illinoinensis]